MSESRTHRTRLVAGLAAAAGFLALTGPGPGGLALADPLPTLYDVVNPCHLSTGSVDVAVGVGDPTVLAEPDDGRTVNLDVLVLLDGVTATRAAEIFADVTLPYAEIGVNVVPTYQTPTTALVQTDAIKIMQEARAQFPGNQVPAAYDMVEILTSKDIVDASAGASVAGEAYCLGGAHSRASAFEVSEATDDPPRRIGPIVTGAQKAAKITAHEMGHLFGGQHEYANCGEDASTTGGLCTLMFYEANLINLHFGTLNGRVVRGYALRYASAND